MPELNAMTVSLEGTHLIEAAAGTGKTYNIQTLVARLLLEKRIPIDKILVVTYTDLATGELRNRLHTILHTLAELADGKLSEAEEDLSRCQALLQAAQRSGLDKSAICSLLRRALLDFDAAAISTIHGFCQRVLSENAFESGVLFRARLEKDISPFVEEVVRDEFRKLFYQQTSDPAAESIRSGLLGALSLTPDKIMDICQNFLSRGTLDLTPESRRKSMLFAEYFKEIVALCKKIPQIPDFNAILPILKGKDIETMVNDICNLVDYARKSRNYPKEFFSAVRKLSPEQLQKILKQPRSQADKDHNQRILANFLEESFFQWVKQLVAKLDDFAESTKSCLVIASIEQFEHYREERRFQTFDDLLVKVHEILRLPGNSLATLLRTRFAAGIIDEFQDTDKIQYEIFHAIFSSPGHAFFMVGDPRQAIYSFRGGDLATYRRADTECADANGKKYTLSVNFRSSSPIINGCNTLYDGLQNPFHDSGILFAPIKPPSANNGGPRQGILLDGHEDPNPIKIYEAPLNKTALAQHCANEILTILSDGRNTIPDGTNQGRPLRCSDVAVLVRSRLNGKAVLAELQKKHIPAVLHDDVNLFDSEDARELAIMLHAVASPRDKNAFLNAALTPLFAIDETELANLQRNDSLRSAKWELLLSPAAAWRKGSFAEMFEELLRVMDLRSRYARRSDGERKLTNLIQLGDALQQVSAERKLDPEETIAQLELAIADRGRSLRRGVFEEQLATDHDAVTIMTVHKSKGLEFPVVFLPFAMEGSRRNQGKGSFHLENAVCLEIGENKLYSELATQEEEAENRRLFYVALTRAKYRCAIFLPLKQEQRKLIAKSDWKKISATSDNDVLSELFLQSRNKLNGNGNTLLETLLNNGNSGWKGLQYLPLSPEFPKSYSPSETTDICQEPPFWKNAIDTDWRFCSYTSLAAAASKATGTDADDLSEDFDEMSDTPTSTLEESPSNDPLLLLPGGANLGSAWHKILEKYDFSLPATDQEQLIASCLYRFGILKNRDVPGSEYEVTCTMLENVIHTPLPSRTGPPFTLAEIRPGDRHTEMEFHLFLRKGFSLQDLTTAIPGATLPKNNLNFSGGCLNGFLDLLFRYDGRWYIADWKSNRLDGILENFEANNLEQAMLEGNYRLQAFLYSTVVYRFLGMHYFPLTQEKFDSLWGGVYYLFVRGISPAHPGRGVWFARPTYQELQALSALFGETE